MELHQLFPNAKFVHIVRNPYSNIVSFRRFFTSGGTYPLLNRMISSMRNNYYFLYKNRDLIPNYYIIRYEDLVQNFDKEIKTPNIDFRKFLMDLLFYDSYFFKILINIFVSFIVPIDILTQLSNPNPFKDLRIIPFSNIKLVK